MFCKNCGTQVKDDAQFCPNCGQVIAMTTIPSSNSMNLLDVVKKIIAEQGFDVLNDSKRINGYLNDLAPNQPKAEKKAFVICLMNRFHAELQNTTEDRQLCKNRLAQKLHDDEGMELALCNNTLDLLEGVLFGEQPQKLQSSDNTIIDPLHAINTPDLSSKSMTDEVIQPEMSTVQKKRRGTKVVIGIAAIAVVIVLIIFAVSNNQPSYTPSSTSTSNNVTAEDHMVFAYLFAHQEMDYVRAIAECMKAIELDPSSSSAYNERAFYLFYLGAYGDALNDINTALSISQDANFYDTRGTLYRSLGQDDDAIADYDRAIQLDSSRSIYFENRAWAYLWRDGNQNQYDKDHAQAVSVDKGGVAGSIKDIAINIMCSGNYDSTVQGLDMALQYTPDDEEIQKLKALAIERKQLGTTFSLAGTKWAHLTSGGDYLVSLFELQANGELQYITETESGSSSWKQNGNEVTLYLNDRYDDMNATFTGRIINADLIQGNLTMENGSTLQTELRR
jgi:Tfp pilus assembly protein PilF